MAETHHDRTKIPPRDEPDGAPGRAEADGEGDASLEDSPPNVEQTEPPNAEHLAGANAASRVTGGADDVARLEREVALLNDRHLRLAAEFDNYRKRIERERAELPRRARAEVVSRLLDVIDDLDRVTAHAESTTTDALLDGVRLVDKKLRALVEGWGLVALDPKDEIFDPATMEAMMTVPAEHPEEDDVVADVFQKGYLLGDLLIRPARVRVKKFEG
jgi:molecular chaperone GrpE